MSTELTPEEADALREQLAAFDAAQHEAAKAANRALLAPLTSIGLGGTEPLTCSLEQAVEAINLPRTTTILALGFLAGNLLFLPVIAWLGDMVAERYADAVMLVASMFKDGMLLILGFYFGRNQASDTG